MDLQLGKQNLTFLLKQLGALLARGFESGYRLCEPFKESAVLLPLSFPTISDSYFIKWQVTGSLWLSLLKLTPKYLETRGTKQKQDARITKYHIERGGLWSGEFVG